MPPGGATVDAPTEQATRPFVARPVALTNDKTDGISYLHDRIVNDMTKAKSKGDAPASELISRYIAEHADWRGKTLARIRSVFHEADPGIVEEWKWMGSPVWSHDGMIAVANAHRDKVKLTFSQGARLSDPHGLFNAGLGGKKWRAIDLYEDDEIDESALRDLVRSAVVHNASSGK